MENFESNEVSKLIAKLERNMKGKSNFEIKPKLVAILLIVNLVVGIFNLAGIGFLSFKNMNRSQMMDNFPNGGTFNPPNGDMFNQQQQQQPSTNN